MAGSTISDPESVSYSGGLSVTAGRTSVSDDSLRLSIPPAPGLSRPISQDGGVVPVVKYLSWERKYNTISHYLNF